MKYEELKDELSRIVEAHYQGGMRTNDIRAAIHAVDLMAEQFGAIELLEIAKTMNAEKASSNAELWGAEPTGGASHTNAVLGAAVPPAPTFTQGDKT